MPESNAEKPAKRKKGSSQEASPQEVKKQEAPKTTYTAGRLIDRAKGIWGDSFPPGESKWVQVYVTSDGAVVNPVMVKAPRQGKVPLYVKLCRDEKTGVRFALAYDQGTKREPKQVQLDGFGAEIRSISVMSINSAESKPGVKDIAFCELAEPPEK
jgi:hypothetical protein